MDCITYIVSLTAAVYIVHNENLTLDQVMTYINSDIFRVLNISILMVGNDSAELALLTISILILLHIRCTHVRTIQTQ